MNPADSITFRLATPEDAEALLAIYAPYVLHTAITFEYTVPTPEEFRGRIAHTLCTYPYIVAEQNGELLGYAYTGAFVGRAAYDWCAATSIYLREDQRGRGLGRRLYERIERISRAQNLVRLYACIAFPEQEDAYLTFRSARFHEHLGYTRAGLFRQCAYKFGTWYHMIWMGKPLSDLPEQPQPFLPLPQLPPEALRDAGLTV